MLTSECRILCVDDEPDMLALTRTALELSGELVVETCNSGAAALALAPSFRPDLILLDVIMPGMDGIATLRALRQHAVLAAIPVVFFTALKRPAEIRTLRGLGVADILFKPFDPLTLARQTKEIWIKTGRSEINSATESGGQERCSQSEGSVAIQPLLSQRGRLGHSARSFAASYARAFKPLAAQIFKKSGLDLLPRDNR